MDVAEATRLVLEIQAGLKQVKVAAAQLEQVDIDEGALSRALHELGSDTGEDALAQQDSVTAVLALLSDPKASCEPGDGDDADVDEEACPECGRGGDD